MLCSIPPVKLLAYTETERCAVQALGMRVPSQLSPDYMAQALGPDEKVPTIDVASQVSGPRMTLADWAEYFKEPEKERLLNVVSLSLAGTPLQVPHMSLPVSDCCILGV